MKLNNLNSNSIETVSKKLNTKTLQSLRKTSKKMKKNTTYELNRRKKAANLIRKKYLEAKRRKIKTVLKNGSNMINEMILHGYFPNNIKNDLYNNIKQFSISNRETTLILKELIDYLLDSTQGSRNVTMQDKVNYVMKTSFKKGQLDLNNSISTYRRFFAE